jgi:hypothetical protein
VLNAMRAQTLPGVNFRDPAAVLMGLNRTFRMDNQNNLFFHGVVWRVPPIKTGTRSRQRGISAGHPGRAAGSGASFDRRIAH